LVAQQNSEVIRQSLIVRAPLLSSIRQSIEKAMSGLLVIAVGVLVALWADSAWEKRVEAVREQEILGDLLAEFRENEFRLRADIATSRNSRDAARAWSAEMRDGGEMPPDSFAGLTPVALAGVPGNLEGAGQRAAVETIEAFAGGPIAQLSSLLEELTAIIELIEGELTR